MKNKYWTIKIRKPKASDVVTVFQCMFILIVGSSVLMAFVLAFSLLFEAIFKVKLI